MDIVLEVFDTFLFDRFWSTVYPASTCKDPINVAKGTTATFSSMRELPTAIHSSTQFFQLAPSQYAYMSEWPRDNIWRQFITLYLITWYASPSASNHRPQLTDSSRLFGLVLYFVFSTLSYIFIFDHATFTHPKYLKNQVGLEIRQTMISMPLMSIFTAPFFLLEVRGYGKLYDVPSDAPFALYNILQFPLFIGFTDLCIYWIHRGLHHPFIYKTLHKPHHKWIMPTPYASHAFHPMDGFAQSIPYHVFPFFFPLQKFAYVALFAFINFWTIFIREQLYHFITHRMSLTYGCRRRRIRCQLVHHQWCCMSHNAPLVLQL